MPMPMPMRVRRFEAARDQLIRALAAVQDALDTFDERTAEACRTCAEAAAQRAANLLAKEEPRP